MMKGEGRLDIVMTRADGSARVTITSSRPLGLTRALTGMACADAAALVPLLFSVCGMAQGAAAAEALGGAQGLEVSASTRIARRLLVLAEAAREHLVAAVRDWPRLAHMAADSTALLRLMQDFQRLRAAIDPKGTALRLDAAVAVDAAAIEAGIAALQGTIETCVLASTCDGFLARHSETAFVAWAEAGRTPAQRLAARLATSNYSSAGAAGVAFLPAGCAVPLLPRLFGPEARAFLAAPTWNEAPCETTALARQASEPLVRALSLQHGGALVTRLAARLVELAALPGTMRGVLARAHQTSAWSYDAARVQADVATAEIDTARGRLIHAAHVREGKIADYAILAPTEWNFHPRGIAAQGLRAMAGSDEFDAKARVFLQMLDPCVAFDVRAA